MMRSNNSLQSHESSKLALIGADLSNMFQSSNSSDRPSEVSQDITEMYQNLTTVKNQDIPVRQGGDKQRKNTISKIDESGDGNAAAASTQVFMGLRR